MKNITDQVKSGMESLLKKPRWTDECLEKIDSIETMDDWDARKVTKEEWMTVLTEDEAVAVLFMLTQDELPIWDHQECDCLDQMHTFLVQARMVEWIN